MSDFEDAAETVRRAGEIALQVHLSDAYKIASEVTTPMLALGTARMVLAEMLRAIPSTLTGDTLHIVIDLTETLTGNVQIYLRICLVAQLKPVSSRDLRVEVRFQPVAPGNSATPRLKTPSVLVVQD